MATMNVQNNIMGVQSVAKEHCDTGKRLSLQSTPSLVNIPAAS